jgi:hypothetical protein
MNDRQRHEQRWFDRTMIALAFAGILGEGLCVAIGAWILWHFISKFW